MLSRLPGDQHGPLGVEMLAMAVNRDRSCPLGIGMVLAEREAWS